MNLPPFISNQDDERANPARLLAVVEDSPGRTLATAGFTYFVTTCSIPMIEFVDPNQQFVVAIVP